MLERDDQDSRRDERSLLSLADSQRTEAAPSRSRLKSAVARARAERDGNLRNGATRPRRAAVEAPVTPPDNGRREPRPELPTRSDEETKQKSWSGRARDWLGRLKPRGGTASAALERAYDLPYPSARAIEAELAVVSVGDRVAEAAAGPSRTAEATTAIRHEEHEVRPTGTSEPATSTHDIRISAAGPRLEGADPSSYAPQGASFPLSRALVVSEA